MNRPWHSAMSKGRAWLLFLLSLVAVAAPAWTDAYVCPMAREALREHKSSCCAKKETVRKTAAGPRIQVACHCPKLTWTANVAQVRDNSASDHASQPLALAPDFSVALLQRVGVAVVQRPVAYESGPPLWVRNLSIRC